MGQGDHQAVGIAGLGANDIVRHATQQGNLGPRPLCPDMLPRVGHQHFVVHGQGQLRQGLAELAGAHQQHALARAEGLAQHIAIPGQRGEVLRRAPVGVVGPHRDFTQQAAPLRHGRQSRAQPGAVAVGVQGLHQHLQAAATGQAQALVLLGADTVFDHRGNVRQTPLPQALQQVILDTAPGEGTDLPAGAVTGQQCAGGARRGTGAGDNGTQPDPAVRRRQPAQRGFEHGLVEGLHHGAAQY